MQIFKGAIITCDEMNTVAKYLVEDNGRIVFVGDKLPEKYINEKVYDLGEGAMIPSFVDTHIHFASFSTFYAGLNVMEARSNRKILDEIKEYVLNHPKEKLILAFGASPYSVEERRLVSRRELDEVCPNKPVFVVKYDGHACVVNSMLLDKVRNIVESCRGYHEDTGEMNQEAFFAISDYVTKSVSIFQLIKNMQKAADYMASRGIGMIHTVSGVGFVKDLDVDLERWVGRGFDTGMQLRVYMQTMAVEKVLKRKLPRVGGCFETALDGCFGSKDAALLKPYKLSDDKGVLYYSDEKVIDFCKKANRAGLQIEMHAIGDAAFAQATKALKAALDDFPRDNHRHAIIHACLPTQEGIDICAKYHILLPMQTAFIDWPQEPEEYLESILGERSALLNPLRTYADAGIIMSFGSDGPCTNPNPMLWIHKACNHTVESQSLSVYEALRMCTYNGYYTSFDEKERGSLECGKIADMVILSQNPYKVDKRALKDISIVELYLGGKAYSASKRGALSHVFHGIIHK